MLGFGGGLVYWPMLFMLPQWFVKRKGLAGGLIFSGSGVGGRRTLYIQPRSY